MGIWIERQLEFMGAYRINLATTALVQLLASRHPALMALQVLPHPVLAHQLFRQMLMACLCRASRWEHSKCVLVMHLDLA